MDTLTHAAHAHNQILRRIHHHYLRRQIVRTVIQLMEALLLNLLEGVRLLGRRYG